MEDTNFFLKVVNYLINSIFGVEQVLLQDCLKNSYLSGAQLINLIEDVVELVVPFGVLILALRWAMSLMREIMTKDFNIEIIFRSFLRLVISVIIVSNSMALINGIVGFSDALYKELFDTLALSEVSTGNPLQGIVDFVTDESQFSLSSTWYGAFVMLAASFFNGLIEWIVLLSLMIHGISRSIAVAQYYVFAPVAMAGIFEGGMSSSTIKYLKKFLAVLLEPALIAIALNCYFAVLKWTDSFTPSGVYDAVTFGIFKSQLMPIIAIAAMVAFIRKARKFAFDLIP